MQVFKGHSGAEDAAQAVREATTGWELKGAKIDLLLVFCSTKQNAGAAARALAQRFPGVPMIGCTTSGEMLDDQHFNGHMVVSGIVSPKIRWAVTAIEDIKTMSEKKAAAASDALLSTLKVDRASLNPERHFCLTFIDGLSAKEESVSSMMADALDGVPLLGGSAGDDLKFKSTEVIINGRALTNAAVFAFGESSQRFEIIKHQHFVTTPRSLVITKADAAQRRVYEIDGLPALEAYARALGLKSSEVTGDVSFMNPILFLCNNEIYVRSIQRIETDGSIVFYCAVEEGMVLDIGGHESMATTLERDITTLKKSLKETELFIACNCILRALEAGQSNQHQTLGKILLELTPNVVGFDTYGEQLGGLHINQTLVGIAFKRAA